ncbi:MAG: D-glycero-beta-D-manno-heptose 1-phosphate adenylyltransferase [Silvanigrellales bacterium]|nr:D-glycero-beta-D-manno-heptose 1-phosphate adenylyltransferase [Silvanigrellales bacterium]
MSENPISRLQCARLFVVGDVVLDEYIHGRVSRISPEAPVPVVLEEERRWVLGGAANVAANVAAFGAKVQLCGRIGDDSDGILLRSLCESEGIDSSGLVVLKGVPTTRKTRLLAGYHQLARIDREVVRSLDDLAERAIVAAFRVFAEETGGSAPGNRALVVSDYGKGVVTDALLSRLLPLARSLGVPVVTDPKSVILSRYAGSTLLKPNLKEARDAFAAAHPASPPAATFLEEVERLCSFLLAEAQVDGVVMSLSEHGVVCLSSQGEPAQATTFRPTALEVADVSGAGDTMVAFLAMALATGHDLPTSTRLANVAAGVVCGKLGTSTLSTAEFFKALSRSPKSPPRKFLSKTEACAMANGWRQADRTIVFTNGCFDILHAGHVDLLQKARSLGDVLVVGLNTDASVKRLKGVTRPLQNENDRASILSGLESVDAVVLFDEETPLQLIRDLKPDILVKGGDYTVETVVGHEDVLARGGRVELIPLVEGRSTTNIVQRASKSL